MSHEPYYAGHDIEGYIAHSPMAKCPLVPLNLVGKINISKVIRKMEDIEQDLGKSLYIKTSTGRARFYLNNSKN